MSWPQRFRLAVILLTLLIVMAGVGFLAVLASGQATP